jgi:hypothetical protein
VLRLASSPFRNLRDTPGIAGERIDNMEERLKAEIVGQWVGMGGSGWVRWKEELSAVILVLVRTSDSGWLWC